MKTKQPKNILPKENILMKYMLVILTVAIVVNTAALFRPQNPETVIRMPEYAIDLQGNTTHLNDSTYYMNETDNLYDSNYETIYHNTSYLNETDNLYDTDYESNYESNYYNSSYLNDTSNLYDSEYNTDFYNSSYINDSDYLYNSFYNESYVNTQHNDTYSNYTYYNDTDIMGDNHTYDITQINNTYNNYTNIQYNNSYVYYNTTGGPAGYNNSETFFIDKNEWDNITGDKKKLYWTVDFGHNVSEIWIYPEAYSPMSDCGMYVSFDALGPYTNDARNYGFTLTSLTTQKFKITTDCMTVYAGHKIFSIPDDKWLSGTMSIIVFGNW